MTRDIINNNNIDTIGFLDATVPMRTEAAKKHHLK
jgi:hypothetical protein